jgi:hypothetical protein
MVTQINYTKEIQALSPGDVVHVDDGFGDTGHYYVVVSNDTCYGTIAALQITSAQWEYSVYTLIDSDDHDVIYRPSRIKNEVYEIEYNKIDECFGPLSKRAKRNMNEMQLRW